MTVKVEPKDKPRPQGTCSSCKFWTSNKDPWIDGWCQRFPKTERTNKYHFCWEFKEAP